MQSHEKKGRAKISKEKPIAKTIFLEFINLIMGSLV